MKLRPSPPFGDHEVANRLLGEGRPPAEALTRAGAWPRLVRFVDGLEGVDLPALLDDVAGALVRTERARAPLRRAALYPLTLATCALAFIVGNRVLLAPDLARLRDAAITLASPRVVDDVVPAVTALVCVVVLGWMALALTRAAPLFPYHQAGRAHERFVLLSAAGAAARAGASTPEALRAAARLVEHRAMAKSARAFAAALERGESQASALGEVAFGPGSAETIFAAAESGVAAEVLGALGEHQGATAEHQSAAVVRAASIQALLLGGLAVAAALLALFLPYLRTLGEVQL